MRSGIGARRLAAGASLACLILGLPAKAAELEAVNPPELRRSPFYSHAVVAPGGARTVYVAGQIGFDGAGRLAPDYEGQVRQAFANLAAVLAAAGARPEHVAKITVLIVDHDETKLGPLADASKALFGDHLPASTLIPVPRLALDGLLFEIAAIAAIPD